MFSTLELREVRVFLVLAEELHYGRAGERLGLTTSRVSQMIRTLEARVGGRLFDRTSRRVTLTPLGRQLRKDMAPAYARLERGFNTARESAVGIAGTLRIGMYSPFLGGPRWATIIETFTNRHPACALEFIDTGTETNYFDWLRSGDADLIALRLPVAQPDVTVGPILSQEPRVLLVSEHDRLAQRTSVSYEEIADHPVSDVPEFPREMMDAFIPPTTPSGKTLRRITNRSIEVALMRVAAGKQVHPTVPSVFENYHAAGIVAIPIDDLPPSESALAWLTANYSQKIAAFVATAEDVLAHAGSRRSLKERRAARMTPARPVES